ncbi:MAG: hypothetical protein ACLU1W_04260 [Collinsella sp.]
MSETGLLPAYLIVGTDGVKRDHAVSRMKARLESRVWSSSTSTSET